MAKKKIVLDYEKLDVETINGIKMKYPNGYKDHLVTFSNTQGRYISALPFEGEEIYYLVRMTELEAMQIIREDSDFGRDGKLLDSFTGEIDPVEEDPIELELEEGEIKKEYLDENLDEAENIKDESFED
ncbi:MAG: hypothetical protein GQ564_11990 [Bacteroidales bacterium]|nr:hypothetical protein [Bacteroidales bacterium]